jgi:hypothetical protein
LRPWSLLRRLAVGQAGHGRQDAERLSEEKHFHATVKLHVAVIVILGIRRILIDFALFIFQGKVFAAAVGDHANVVFQ